MARPYYNICGSALGEARHRLDADRRPLGELGHRARAHVGGGAPHPRADAVEQVLDPGPLRVQQLPRGRDALLEQGLARAVEPAVAAGAGAHRPLARHPEGLLVGPPRLVAQQVAGRLERARQPGADHHGGRARSQRQRDVTRVAHAAVGPHLHALLAPGRRALEYGGELRSPDPGHHPRGAHRARPDADLHDVRARRGEVAHPLGGDDVARGHRHVRPGHRADGGQRVEHLVLVAVRGVDDQHVHPGGEQRLRLDGHVPVDPDGGRGAKPPRRVERGRVDPRAQRAERGEQACEPAVGVQPERGAPPAQRLEHVAGRCVERQRDDGGIEHVGEPREPVHAGAGRLVDGADRAPAVVHHHDGAVRALGQQRQRLGHRVARAEGERGVPDDVPRLDPRDDVGHRRRRDVLGEHGERTTAGEGFGHPTPRDRRHVRGDHGHGRACGIGADEVHVEPGRHRGTAGDEEHVVVGEVVLRGLPVEEAHGRKMLRAATDSHLCARAPHPTGALRTRRGHRAPHGGTAHPTGALRTRRGHRAPHGGTAHPTGAPRTPRGHRAPDGGTAHPTGAPRTRRGHRAPHRGTAHPVGEVRGRALGCAVPRWGARWTGWGGSVRYSRTSARTASIVSASAGVLSGR